MPETRAALRNRRSVSNVPFRHFFNVKRAPPRHKWTVGFRLPGVERCTCVKQAGFLHGPSAAVRRRSGQTCQGRGQRHGRHRIAPTGGERHCRRELTSAGPASNGKAWMFSIPSSSGTWSISCRMLSSGRFVAAKRNHLKAVWHKPFSPSCHGAGLSLARRSKSGAPRGTIGSAVFTASVFLSHVEDHFKRQSG